MTDSTLGGYQRAYLKKIAHHRHPLVFVGTKGLSPQVSKALDEALNAHELVKVKFQDCKEERVALCVAAASELGAELVAVVGNIGIFYRMAKNPEDRNIRLPERTDSGE